MFRLLLLGALIAFVGVSCQRTAEVSHSPSPSPSASQTQPLPAPGPKVEACALITADEVAAIQGTTIRESKQNEIPTGEFITSQCYYSSVEPDQSVTLAVIQRNGNPTTARSVHQYWADAFGRFRAPQREKEGDESVPEPGDNARQKESGSGNHEGEEKDAVHAIKVDGIGEEAFWSTNAVGGVLYALKGENIVRVSVGGRAKMEEKLEKSKALAQRALKRIAVARARSN